MEDNVLNCLNSKDVIVYGAGAIARKVVPYMLKTTNAFKIAGIALTNPGSINPFQFEKIGLQIKSIQEWYATMPDATILIATSEQYHTEICSVCREAGYKDIVCASTELRAAITYKFFRQYFQSKSISLKEELITIRNMKFLNPLRGSVNGWDRDFILFCNLLGEIVFPHIYPDWDMIVDGPYDRYEADLSGGDVVLDCGANMGIFSVYAASKGCRVYAFEPTPELQEVLKRHSAENIGGGLITPVEAAIANYDGTVRFLLSADGYDSNSLMDRGSTVGSIEVQQTTIDAFVEEYGLNSVDFIKADIEGAERLMLAGAQNTLARFGPKLSLCTYHYPDDKEVLTNLILQANPDYKIEYQWGKLYAYV